MAPFCPSSSSSVTIFLPEMCPCGPDSGGYFLLGSTLAPNDLLPSQDTSDPTSSQKQIPPRQTHLGCTRLQKLLPHPRGIQTPTSTPVERGCTLWILDSTKSLWFPLVVVHNAAIFLLRQPCAFLASSSPILLWGSAASDYLTTLIKPRARNLNYRVLIPPRAPLPLPPCLTDACYLIHQFEKLKVSLTQPRWGEASETTDSSQSALLPNFMAQGSCQN